MKNVKYTLIAVVAILILVGIFSSFYTVNENEYATTVRFSKIVNTTSSPGLHMKIPFVDNIRIFPKAIMSYDIPPSEVLTSDKKNMTVDSYILWHITDPLSFFQSLGSIGVAEERLNALTYNALKNAMGKLEQNTIINQDESQDRNNFYEVITESVGNIAKTYGIEVVDIKVKRLDLPEDNEQAVYNRMISDRTQIAEKFIADGNYESSIIRNDVDKQVNILVSNAKANAAKLIADGEAEYMRMLAAAFNTPEKKTFYEFTRALEALKASLIGSDKTVILSSDSELAKLIMGPQ